METGRFRSKRVYFSQVSNHALRDTSLSLKAKGLYSLIQSYITIEGFVLYKSFLQKQCKDGRDSFNSSWNELKRSGYLVQYKMRGENNKFRYEYELLDVPEEEEDKIPIKEDAHTKEEIPIKEDAPTKEEIPIKEEVSQEDKDLIEIHDAFVSAFDSQPNNFVKASFKRYMAVFKEDQKEIILESISIAAIKNKGWDYSAGILKNWIKLDLFTWDDVFNYLQN